MSTSHPPSASFGGPGADPLPQGEWRYVANTELVDPARVANTTWTRDVNVSSNGRLAVHVHEVREPGRRPMSDNPALLAACSAGDENAVRMLLARWGAVHVELC
jgi:hypothetical protein